MNNKILLGSIIAVVMLVLVSFTGVVGYQTTSTTIAKASPLFSVRSKRAIDEESRDLTCDYVGKGKDIAIYFPTSNSRNTQMQRVIDIISRMDDKTFNRFVKLFVYQANNNNKMKDISNNDIIGALYIIKVNPELLNNHLIVGKNDDSLFTKGGCDTAFPLCRPEYTIFGMEWKPQCYLESIALILLIGGFVILFYLGGILYFLCESLPFLKTLN